MYKLFKKLSTVALITIIFVNLAPLTLAQSDLTSPLDDIKEKLRDSEVQVIDYSENKWGKLSDRVISVIDGDFSGLENMYIKLNTSDYTGSEPFTGETDFTSNDFYSGKCIGDDGTAKNSCEDGDIPVLTEAIEALRSDLSSIQYSYTYEDGSKIENVFLSKDDINLIIDEMFAYKFSGERQLRDVTQAVVKVIRNIIGTLAVIWIIIAGARMVFAGGDETVITEQKRSIIFALIGLVAILLVDRSIDIIYGPAGTFRTALDETTTSAFSMEVYGVVNFIKAVIGSVAILFIIMSGLKTIFAQGEEEQITKQRKSLIWIIVGFVLLLVDKIIVEQFFIVPVQFKDEISTNNVTSIISTMGRIMQFALGFVGLIALGTLIYGAGMMIANYGNDELVQKSKKIIKNSIIGIIVIISAYTIVATLIVFS